MKNEFYMHRDTGEIYMTMTYNCHGDTTGRCEDDSPLLVCLDDGNVWSVSSTFGGEQNCFFKLRNVKIEALRVVEEKISKSLS